MSTFCVVTHKCGVCGNEFDARVTTSTNSFGSPDLDMRPSMMMRSTMSTWVQKCPRCGYVHADIEAEAQRHKEFIESEKYVFCDDAKLACRLACNFYRYAMILLQDGETAEAYDAFLHAAWACDDVDDKCGARLCRRRAISLYGDELFDGEINLMLRHIDVLRRAGHFKEARKLCESKIFKKDFEKKIAKFQLKLSLNKDDGCYTLYECDKDDKK